MPLLLIAYYGILFLLTVYALHRLHLVFLSRRFKPSRNSPPADEWPSITIQLPMFNEPAVAIRVIRAAAGLRYPGVLDIQVLDDSTDETSERIAPVIDEIRDSGVTIFHVRRTARKGFKAGALAHGMSLSTARLFAVFDADFLPHPDTLLKMVGSFRDESIGMVQARWGHLNREDSSLTRSQAIFLDAHFAVESVARFGSGAYFNFNGTAGIWRREAIEEAGGWSAATLTEDLDLSYRAQLAGWRFAFLEEMEVAAELPPTMSAFQEQQFRWAKGSVQTMRRMLGSVVRSGAPARVCVEAFFHLTGNFAYLLTVCLAMLIVPVMDARRGLISLPGFAADAILLLTGTFSLWLFYFEGQRRVGRRLPLRDLFMLIPLGISMSLRNSAAVIEGLAGSGGEFRRTPKRGAGAILVEGSVRWPLSELLLSTYLAIAVVTAIIDSQYVRLPFLALFFAGYGLATWQLLAERRRCDWAHPSLTRHLLFREKGVTTERSCVAHNSRRIPGL